MIKFKKAIQRLDDAFEKTNIESENSTLLFRTTNHMSNYSEYSVITRS